MNTAGSILVADDNQVFLKMVVGLLEQAGYACDAVEDAPQAAKLLASKDYDLFVSDVEMPGNENLCLIRDVPQIVAGLPVILMTAYPTMETAIESIHLPVTAYLVKPFEKEVLLHHVQRAVRHYQAQRALRLSLRRLEQWNQDLAQIQAGVQRFPKDDSAPWRLLFDLTLRNVSASLADLRVFAESAALQPAEDKAETGTASHPLLLVNALRETIAVLEKTKNSFRSKELGELRKRLEGLVSGTPPQA